MMDDLIKKEKKLEKHLLSLGCTAVAFSSGVDSTYLLHKAAAVLGPERVLAVTAASCVLPQKELQEAKDFCMEKNIRHVILRKNVLEIEGFRENPRNRCYLCKKSLFQDIVDLACANEMPHVIEGSNTDDLSDFRPGMQAIQELGILSPLLSAGMSKNDIRALSEQTGLPTWNKPSFACLASRIPYGETITEQKLHMVETAEQFLMDRGYRQVRVRLHGGQLARIEVDPEDMPRITDPVERDLILSTLHDMEFRYITLDLLGYRTGSMN